MFVTDLLNNYKSRDDKYNGLIKILADPAFLQACYMLIKGKPGNMTVGTTVETLDGISLQWFIDIANEIKSGKFKFNPARKVMIPKPGKKERRPLSVGAPREKIIQKGIQIILEAIYEPTFLDCSHGFRPDRSTHSALKILHLKAHQHTWVIQGDISKCFDRIPHSVIMKVLGEKIKCERLLALISKALKAGHIDPESKRHIRSTEGTPQGSGISPLLANMVLHILDVFVNQMVEENTTGKRRKTNPEYNKMCLWLAVIRDPRKRYYWEATAAERKEALKKMMSIPRMDTRDPDYRRAMYVRYADDFVFLLEGPKEEAVKIKERIKDFLMKELGLELNDQKTLITHIGEGFNFLGANVKSLPHTGFRARASKHGPGITMRAHVRARVNAPTKILMEKLIKLGFAKRDSNKQILAKPMTKMVNHDHSTIIQFYNTKITGILNYYSFASNRSELHNVVWILTHSLAKTLARKYKLNTSRQAFAKFGPNLADPDTDLKLNIPRSLHTTHQYNVKEHTPGAE